MRKNTDRHGRTRTYTDDTTVLMNPKICWDVVAVYLVTLSVGGVMVSLAAWKVIDLVRWML